MGIESDQLVYDYLSRVGDLAHGTSMTAAERARLVTGLRGEIDRMRAAEGGAQSKAAVRKILTRIGDPAELVAAAAGGTGVPEPRAAGEDGAAAGGGEPARERRSFGGAAPAAGGTASREGAARPRPRVPRLPQMRKAERAPAPEAPRPPAGASPPHLAGIDELGPDESDPDWWRVDPTPYGDGGGRMAGRRPGSDLVPGFVGGIEIPEVLKPPPGDGEDAAAGAAARTGAAAGAVAGGTAVPVEKADEGTAAGKAGRRPSLGKLLRRRAGGGAGPAAGGIVELASAALLVTGAVMGSLIPLGLGWLGSWWSPRLSRNEAKWATLGMPGLTAAGGGVWLWGRGEGRWDPPLAEGEQALRAALEEAWPVALRVAAVASALFLLWRARRRTG
ncbi:hypothetical protein [Streptomyces sp. JJ36]|uniref:hypothetical protein n=1 Tax=Streptomyces sp. JJ36 TaxID=2736645 RepID=UPI001F435B37|nr:hypothetical protein [Streptomyces sp. JJ36]MCF6523074.1 hypothetical protein [Streptomyces sp. JJ36]